MPVIKKKVIPPDDPIFEEGYSLSSVRKPQILLGMLKKDLARVEKRHGSDNPLAKQLQIQLAVIEEGGNARSAFLSLEDSDD